MEVSTRLVHAGDDVAKLLVEYHKMLDLMNRGEIGFLNQEALEKTHESFEAIAATISCLSRNITECAIQTFSAELAVTDITERCSQDGEAAEA